MDGPILVHDKLALEIPSRLEVGVDRFHMFEYGARVVAVDVLLVKDDESGGAVLLSKFLELFARVEFLAPKLVAG